MDHSAKLNKTDAKIKGNTKTVNELPPLSGPEPIEDVTQRAKSSYEQGSVRSLVNSQILDKCWSKDDKVPAEASQVKSVQSSVMRSDMKDLSEDSSADTIFVETRAVRRPAIVKEPNNWIKKQPIVMSRKLPLGIQPEDIEARQLSKMHSHTGLSSKSNSISISGTSNLPPAAAISHPGLLPPSTQPHLDSAKVRKISSKQKPGLTPRLKSSPARVASPLPHSILLHPSTESAVSKIARSIFPTKDPSSLNLNRILGNDKSPSSNQLHNSPEQHHHHVKRCKSLTNEQKVSSNKNKNT